MALVTGASRGIGREIALTLARQGAAVGLNYLPAAEQTALAHALLDELRRLGARAVALPADVTDGMAMREAGRRLVETFGRVDVVVTNAGIIDRRPFLEVTEADWDRVVAVNLKGTFNAIQAVLPYLVRQRSGKIVTDTDMLRSNPEFRDENRANVPLGRWGHPRDIALTVLFLASAESDFYAGQVLSPNGGVVM